HLAHDPVDYPRDRFPLGRREPTEGVLWALPVPRDDTRRRLHVPRPPALRGLLGTRHHSDVLPYRDLGWAEPPIRGPEVPHLHANRFSDHAALDLCTLLQQCG